MGIFQSRPEEPSEWAGLPAEPWQPPVPGEVLPPNIDAFDLLGGAVTSYTVPTELVVSEGEPADITSDGDGE